VNKIWHEIRVGGVFKVGPKAGSDSEVNKSRVHTSFIQAR